MKSPVLIFFIILNLFAINLVSAMNMFDDDTTESHLVHSKAHSDSEPTPANCVDESSCSHFCHMSSHMMGFISQFAVMPEINEVISTPTFKEHFHSLILDPPFQPPQA